jgi:hypothetical protein
MDLAQDSFKCRTWVLAKVNPRVLPCRVTCYNSPWSLEKRGTNSFAFQNVCFIIPLAFRRILLPVLRPYCWFRAGVSKLFVSGHLVNNFCARGPEYNCLLPC